MMNSVASISNISNNSLSDSQSDLATLLIDIGVDAIMRVLHNTKNPNFIEKCCWRLQVRWPEEAIIKLKSLLYDHVKCVNTITPKKQKENRDPSFPMAVVPSNSYLNAASCNNNNYYAQNLPPSCNGYNQNLSSNFCPSSGGNFSAVNEIQLPSHLNENFQPFYKMGVCDMTNTCDLGYATRDLLIASTSTPHQANLPVTSTPRSNEKDYDNMTQSYDNNNDDDDDIFIIEKDGSCTNATPCKNNIDLLRCHPDEISPLSLNSVDLNMSWNSLKLSGLSEFSLSSAPTIHLSPSELRIFDTLAKEMNDSQDVSMEEIEDNLSGRDNYEEGLLSPFIKSESKSSDEMITKALDSLNKHLTVDNCKRVLIFPGDETNMEIPANISNIETRARNDPNTTSHMTNYNETNPQNNKDIGHMNALQAAPEESAISLLNSSQEKYHQLNHNDSNFQSQTTMTNASHDISYNITPTSSSNDKNSDSDIEVLFDSNTSSSNSCSKPGIKNDQINHVLSQDNFDSFLTPDLSSGRESWIYDIDTQQGLNLSPIDSSKLIEEIFRDLDSGDYFDFDDILSDKPKLNENKMEGNQSKNYEDHESDTN